MAPVWDEQPNEKATNSAPDSSLGGIGSDLPLTTSTSSNDIRHLHTTSQQMWADDISNLPCDDDMIPHAWDDFGTPSVFTEMPSMIHSRIWSRRPSGGATPLTHGNAGKAHDGKWGSGAQIGSLDPATLQKKIECLQFER